MFTVFKKILKAETLTEEDYGKISPFVMCRWLAGNPNTLQLGQFLNMYYKMPVEAQVLLIQSVLGKKVKYIPYIKGSKTDDKDLENISKYFNISGEKANLYSEFITDKDLEYIRKKLDEKEGMQRILTKK